MISNRVTCYAVSRGFFLFEFISGEDRDLIFRNGPYFMSPQGLYLNRWTPDFNPVVGVPKAVSVWVHLPNLSIHCWTPSSLQTIGNGLGKYIDKANPKDQYSCAKIRVEVDLEVGLPEAIKLTVGDWQHFQKLDYEQLSFKCRHCHDYGHFQKNCPKIPQTQLEREAEEGWKQAKQSKANPKPSQRRQGRNTNPPIPRKEDTIQKPQTDIGNRFVVLEDPTKEASSAKEVLIGEDALGKASSPKSLRVEGKGSPNKTLGKNTPQEATI